VGLAQNWKTIGVLSAGLPPISVIASSTNVVPARMPEEQVVTKPPMPSSPDDRIMGATDGGRTEGDQQQGVAERAGAAELDSH
jgi:hypothetical protein